MPRLENDLIDVRAEHQKTDARDNRRSANWRLCQSERKALEALANKGKEVRNTLMLPSCGRGTGGVAQRCLVSWKLTISGWHQNWPRRENRRTKPAAYVGKLEGMVEALQGDKPISLRSRKK